MLFDPKVKEIFFSDKNVLLEGPSEEITSYILIQEGKLNITNVSIIKARLKDNIPRFLKVFNSLGIPYSVLIDEDPYFLPHYTKTNPSKIKEKRRAYKKTIEIADKVDESLGKIIVISPDFDEFLGVSRNQIDKLGKPTAIYNKFRELEENNDDIIKKIENLFNKLINPESLKFKLSNPDGSKWEYQYEKLVTTPKANYEDFKETIKIKIKLHKEVHDSLTTEEIEELRKMFNPKKKRTKNGSTGDKSIGPLNSWLR